MNLLLNWQVLFNDLSFVIYHFERPSYNFNKKDIWNPIIIEFPLQFHEQLEKLFEGKYNLVVVCSNLSGELLECWDIKDAVFTKGIIRVGRMIRSKVFAIIIKYTWAKKRESSIVNPIQWTL